MSKIFDEKCTNKFNGSSKSIDTTSSSLSRNISTTQSTSEASNAVSKVLKTLLSTSTALPSPATTISSSATKISTTVPLDQTMITKEFNDTQLNLKKILYEPDKETAVDKDHESIVQIFSHKNLIDIQTIDDDDRLVIDISDDETDGQKKKKINSMPILENQIDGNQNKIMTSRMPKSITYSVETSGIKSNCVKIDILTSSSSYFHSDAIEVSKNSISSSKLSTISLNDELNILSHEIDKHINKKTNEILELVKEYLGTTVSETEFQSKMNEFGSITACDLLLISKKLIKRHKFEHNPNQKDFMRIKYFQFPTGSRDLINYFANLIPTMNKDKFIKMIKFYEIIVKEMLNLNKTKILQYLIDFMIKRKNDQLDLLNYNYESNSSPNLKQTVSSTSSFEMPDSTQMLKSERKVSKLRDTSYNFVIRSDPIYLTAGSTFMTNHQDVIKCRPISSVQIHKYERRPFDNNLLKGRRINRRMLCEGNEDDRMKRQNVEMKSQNVKILDSNTVVLNNPLADDRSIMKLNHENDISTKSLEAPNQSPISIKSITPSASPPIHKIIKNQVNSEHVIQTERSPIILKSKEQNPQISELSKSNQEFTRKNTDSQLLQTLNKPTAVYHKDSLINGQISFNEIKTLNQNGTEIIPTPLRNTITRRRKTIDVDHVPAMKSSVEVKKIIPNHAPSTPVTIVSSKAMHDFMQEPPATPKQSMPKILRRRQSCHERLFVATTSTTSSDIGKNFIGFMNDEYEQKKRESTENQRVHDHLFDNDKLMHFHKVQKSITPLHTQQKRVRFLNDDINDVPQYSSPSNEANLIPISEKSQHNQVESQMHPTSIYHQMQNSQIQPLSKDQQSAIDYQQYQLYFERQLRERGFVDCVETLQDKESSVTLANRPVELISHVPPERYHQHSEPTQSTNLTSPRSLRNADKIQRTNHRTPIMTNDEKATLVAYHQLQSLHRDPSNLTPQQYSEHLKQIYQLKQMQVSTISIPPNFHHAELQNQLQNERENFYKNTQQAIHQHENLSSSPRFPYISTFQPKETTQSQGEYNEKEHQSLQRKLKLKSKSSKYVEPSQIAKPYFTTPRSTYYADPCVTTTHNKKPPTPNIYNIPQERPIDPHPQEQVSSFYNLRNERSIDSQIQYQWMIAQSQNQQHHQQQPLQGHTNHHNQPARPIPRPAIPQPYRDMKLNGIPHNIFSHHFPNQQSEFYRHFFHPKSF